MDNFSMEKGGLVEQIYLLFILKFIRGRIIKIRICLCSLFFVLAFAV